MSESVSWPSSESEPAPTEYVTRNEREVVDLTFELLRFDTQNPPGNTTTVIDWLETYFERLGVQTERIAIDRNKPNLLATLSGTTVQTLLYAGHLDTVPFDATAWQHDPLGERRGERIRGRGATDMQGAVASMLLTIRTFVETDTTPPVTLQFAFVSDEETGGDAGMKASLDETTLTADGCVIGETTGESDHPSLAVADRGSLWLTPRAEGAPAPGSRTMLGANAIKRLWDAIGGIEETLDRRQLSADSDLEPIIADSVDYCASLLGPEPTRELFAYPTLNLDVLECGTAVNAVPETATAQFDTRFTAGVHAPDVLSELQSCLADYEGVAIVDSSWCDGTYDRLDGPLVKVTTQLVRDVTGERVLHQSATGSGDAHRLRVTGVPTIECAFGTDSLLAVDEFTTITALVRTSRLYTGLPYTFDHQLNAEQR